MTLYWSPIAHLVLRDGYACTLAIKFDVIVIYSTGYIRSPIYFTDYDQ